MTNKQSALSVSEEECRQRLEEAWQAGGIGFLTAYDDFGFSEAANMRVQEFVRDNIRETVKDPETAEKLLPHSLSCGVADFPKPMWSGTMTLWVLESAGMKFW